MELSLSLAQLHTKHDNLKTKFQSLVRFLNWKDIQIGNLHYVQQKQINTTMYFIEEMICFLGLFSC